MMTMRCQAQGGVRVSMSYLQGCEGVGYPGSMSGVGKGIQVSCQGRGRVSSPIPGAHPTMRPIK